MRKTMPNPRRRDAISEVNNSRKILRDFLLTSNVKNQPRKTRPRVIETKARCGTMAMGTGGW